MRPMEFTGCRSVSSSHHQRLLIPCCLLPAGPKSRHKVDTVTVSLGIPGLVLSFPLLAVPVALGLEKGFRNRFSNGGWRRPRAACGCSLWLAVEQQQKVMSALYVVPGTRARSEGRMSGETAAPAPAIRDGKIASSAPTGLSSQRVYSAQRPVCMQRQNTKDQR